MTDKLREAAQMALDALRESKPIDIDDPSAFYRSAHAIEALNVALAQPEQLPSGDPAPQQEPVAYDVDGATVYIKPPIHNGKYLTGYTAPPQRKEWQEWCQCKDAPNDCTYEKNCRVPQIDAAFKRIEWQGLTPEEAREISLANRPYVIDMVYALEAKLKEKNS